MARYAIKPLPRPNRVREAVPVYGATPEPAAYAVTMADRGRLVLPLEVRERLKIKAGDRLTLRIDPDGTLKLQTAVVFAHSLLGIYKHLAPGRSMVAELIAERRREAAMEDRKERDDRARQKRKARR